MSFQAFSGFKVEPENLKNKHKLRTTYVLLDYISIRPLERQDGWCLKRIREAEEVVIRCHPLEKGR